MVKICHNLLLGVVTQSLAEITVLAEKGGVPRSAFLEFINHSVMGSTFSRYKTPAFVNLDWTPTFTPLLLRKDLDLGLEAAKRSACRCRSRSSRATSSTSPSRPVTPIAISRSCSSSRRKPGVTLNPETSPSTTGSRRISLVRARPQTSESGCG